MNRKCAPSLWPRAFVTFAIHFLLLISVASRAEDVVRIVVPEPPGGGLAAPARALATGLSSVTGASYIVENRPCAITALGADLAARAPADGKTILYSGSAIVMNPWLQKLAPSP